MKNLWKTRAAHVSGWEGGDAEGGGWKGGKKKGGGRGMTNPGRWLDCQWQVNIDVEEVFFTFSAFLFCDSGTAEPNTKEEEAGEEERGVAL